MAHKLCTVLRTCEKNYIFHVLYRYKGNRAKTAKALGIGESTLYRKLIALNIRLKQWK